MTAVSTVPTIVARGIVRAGSRTLPAGIVAHSSPRNAHSVSVTVATSCAANGDAVVVGQSERRRLEEHQAAEADERQRQNLERCRDHLHTTGRLDADDVDADEQPHRRDRERRRRAPACARARGRTDRDIRQRPPRALPAWPRPRASSPTRSGSLARRRTRAGCRRTALPRRATAAPGVRRPAPASPIRRRTRPTRSCRGRGTRPATPATGTRPSRSCSPSRATPPPRNRARGAAQHSSWRLGVPPIS